MNAIFARAGLVALALGITVSAHAGVSEDFSECDGLKKPKSSDDGMRGEATFPSYRFSGRDAPSQTLAACDRVLESGKLLPEQTLRRAHVMRARAAAKLELGDAAGALADIDAAQEAGKAYAGDFFYDRSMGVSLDLLRALALNETGERKAALALAEAAAAKRTYALEVQRVAGMLRAANGDKPADPTIWQGLARIDPATRGIFSQLASQSGDLAELAASAGTPSVAMPEAPSLKAIMTNGGNIAPLLSEWSAPVRGAMTKAYALAAHGQPAAARAWVEATRAALDAARPAGNSQGEAGKQAPKDIVTLLVEMARAEHFKPLADLVDARIAIAEGRLADAAAALQGKQLRATPVTEEFHAAYAAARSASALSAPDLPPLGPAAKRGPARLSGMADDLLIRPESQRKLIDYEKSRPNILGALVGAAFSMGTTLLGGIDRTAGFRSTPNDDGSIKVEYTGNTTSGPVVQEMTLLRAAELAREAGKSHFHVVGRNDYQRYLTQTMNGVPMNRTLTGYKTELTIRLLGEGEADALDAVAVIDALGPVYYES
ncbi:hypothetical protein ATE68_18985 [Sphingopyxis sp. H038]|uniref:hypothetical protein n=2 Tax=Sphingopyxis TaxID=165697 RepID=UPI0007300C57|nr:MULTISPECIES: hypothetical protein [unclassified Sphingopyxis]KTE67746.1 hypothetical protein ATE74_12010 [Sphingopyxis sp. H085]KTE01094.1 hypothetical protein ATE78_15340 [Sphingopyxis sp. H012]KTE12441.1 hypothetical protein ATE70_03965 [Sphingopyxis sp. H053]KTE14143.1 hypothetical protein ATE76_09125 [Sphingopyxis sp. H093]KTE21529.1 hypothetical protein ATE75_21040 [Sphingopyxis sp. H080]